MSGEPRPRACPACLRRAWLVASLAGYIEKAVDDTPGSRARELLALPDAELARALAGSRARTFLRRARERDPQRMRTAVAGSGAWVTCRHDEIYPEAMRDLGDAPPAIFGRGRPGILADLGRDEAVTVIGSRRPSRYGKQMARELGGTLATAGYAVVSGMALGIDSAAQEGALGSGGLTVAVLGCGVDLPYPPRSARLYEQIVERGLVIAELPPGTEPRRWTFPARNRIMAALGAMTVVVEARERSGSLITADLAASLNREVGAVPGLVGTSPGAGTNALIHDGAHLVRDAQDVLDVLLGPGATRLPGSDRVGPILEDGLGAVLEALERGSGDADALALASGLQPGLLSSALVRLELSGYVRRNGEGRYERTSLAPPEPVSASRLD
jgi:DNA processing protein